MTRAGGRPADAKQAKLGTVAELYAVGACKAKRCGGASIRWVPTAKVHPRTGGRLFTGAPVPLDQGRDPAGPIVLDYSQKLEQWAARLFDDHDDPGRPRYSLHWTSCHSPDLYVAVRADADRLGILPGVRRHEVQFRAYAPCARCRVEAPHVLGYLCLGCARAVVAGWSPAMAPTVAAWPAELRGRLLAADERKGSG